MNAQDIEAELNQVASKIDPLLGPCPACGGQLRGEFKVEWRTVAEACEVFGVSEAELREAGATLDGFGRIKSAVPYTTCMNCGVHLDASKPPAEESHDDQL